MRESLNQKLLVALGAQFRVERRRTQKFSLQVWRSSFKLCWTSKLPEKLSLKAMRRAKYLQTRRKWDVRRQTLNIFIYSETGILHFNACRATFRGTWGILDESAYTRTHTSLAARASTCTESYYYGNCRTYQQHPLFIYVCSRSIYLYSMQNPTVQPEHTQRACLRGGAAFWLISLSALCIVLRTALIYILIRYQQPGHALPI